MIDYEVTIIRTEAITFRLSASSPEDAEARYLSDGEETGAETISTEVESITRMQERIAREK